MLCDELIYQVGSACEGVIERYAQKPRREATKDKPAEYRTAAEVQRFIDGLLDLGACSA